MTTNMADDEQAPEETVNAPEEETGEAPAAETEAAAEPGTAEPTEAPATPASEETPPAAEATTPAPEKTPAAEATTPAPEETPAAEATTPAPEAEDAAKPAVEPTASPGEGDGATEAAGVEGEGKTTPGNFIIPDEAPPGDEIEGTKEQETPPGDQDQPAKDETPAGDKEAAATEEGGEIEGGDVRKASVDGDVVTPGGEKTQSDKEPELAAEGTTTPEIQEPELDLKDQEEGHEVDAVSGTPTFMGSNILTPTESPSQGDILHSPLAATTPDTFSLLSGPETQAHLMGELYEGEEPLKEVEEVEESLLAPEYDREELLERYHKALHGRHELQEKNYQLQHKLADYFRKKKSDEVRQETNKNVSDQEQRYLKYMANLDDLRRQEQEKREDYMLEIEDVKKKCEFKQEKVEEERGEFVDFKKQIALNAVNSRSGKFISPKDVESYMVTESRKEMDVANVRLENIKLKNKLKKKEQQLKSKEELAEGLHLIDFEQLKIENQTYNEKIEERNEELLKLRKKITSTVQVLTHLKEKLQFVQAENQIQKRKLQSVEELAAKKRDILSRTKQARDGLRIDNQKLRGQCGLLANKSLLRDYEERIDESDYLRQRIQDLTMKHAELTLNLNGIKRRIEQAKASQVV